MRLFRVVFVTTSLLSLGLVGCGGGAPVDQPKEATVTPEDVQDMGAKMKEAVKNEKAAK